MLQIYNIYFHFKVKILRNIQIFLEQQNLDSTCELFNSIFSVNLNEKYYKSYKKYLVAVVLRYIFQKKSFLKFSKLGTCINMEQK